MNNFSDIFAKIVKDFEELIEDTEDLAYIATLKDEETVPHEEVIADLKQNGLL